MNKTELRNQIEARIALDKKVLQLLDDQLRISRECARQSQIVAGLVLQYGGFIEDHYWKKCSSDLDRFIPQGLSVVSERADCRVGVEITIKEDFSG